jgi:hypothetical protein
MRTSSQKDRAKLHALTQEKLRNVSDFAESELNAVVTDKKIEDARLTAELLLSHILKWQRVDLYTKFEYELSAEELKIIKNAKIIIKYRFDCYVICADLLLDLYYGAR